MSTVLPILSEEDCDMFILELFGACKVTADKTPGFSQLQAFRDSILPLARKTAFKDKFYQHHILLGRLRSADIEDLSSSMPSVETLVQLVLLFGRLLEDSRAMLSYHGWQGASWVITHARYVLGLPVCVLRTPQDPVPINGQYESSRVLVYIYEIESRCEFMVGEMAADLIVVTAQERGKLNRWMVDLDNVNLRELYLPQCSIYHSSIPRITYSLTCVLIDQMVEYFNFDQYSNLNDSGLKTYMDYCSPQIRGRALTIINKLGFSLGSDTAPYPWLCKDHPASDRQTSDTISIVPCDLWAQMSLAATDLDDEHEHDGKIKSLYFTDEAQHIVALLFVFAEMAAGLAMTDWGKNVRLVSTESLASDIHGNKFSEQGKEYTSYTAWGSWTVCKEFIRYDCNALKHRTTAIEKHLTYLLGLATNTTWLDHSRAYHVMAMESEGVVMTRASAEHHSIDFEGIIYKIYKGYISMFGERRPRIQQQGYRIEARPVRNFPCGGVFRPMDGFPTLQIRYESRLCRTHIEIANRVPMEHMSGTRLVEELINAINPAFGEDGVIKSIYVTSTCSHGYYGLPPWTISSDVIIGSGVDFDRGPENGFHKGLFFELSIFLAAVDQNSCGQWISAHGNALAIPDDDTKYIMQRNMCTHCTIKCIENLLLANKELRSKRWYIIPARLKGEVMD
ncbi:MAG: hypothetical protein Q9169_003699 [Polycauliona sp. 2 TL-2023]